MEPIKRLMLFTDLEGTILRESDGKYDEEEMVQFLSKIEELQKLTGMLVDIHIVSPMLPDMMKRIIDRLDKSIFEYNSKHQHSICVIAGATASPESKAEECYLVDKRIMPLPKGVASITDASFGKKHYVREWYNAMRDKDRFGMAIYCGNGRNDVGAMRFIKEQKLGYIVCPKNSRTEIRGLVDHLSTKEDLPGITEGIEYVIKELKERKKGDKEKNDDELEK